MQKLAKDRYCTGCLACKDACNKNAIRIVYRNGLTHVSVDVDKCINCRLCENVCPVVSPVSKNKVENMRTYGGWALNPKLRHEGASGGAFAGIALSFISEHECNVAVYGASLRNNKVSHERITDGNNIHLLMNSKYIQSSTDGVYKKVKEDLNKGLWVLFSGTPCQIAGLYGFLRQKRNDEKLLTVEVVCHGIPGQEALDLHLHHFKSSCIYSFRNKVEGQNWKTSQCTTIERDGKPYRFKREDDVFYQIFSSWLLDRKSCSNCLYSSINRVADITIADFWGGARNESEYKEGVNVIVANNEKGDTFVKKSRELTVYGSTLAKAIGSNPNFYSGYKFIQWHPVVLWPNFFRHILPKNIWMQIIRNRMPWKILWAPYKLLTIFRARMLKRKIVKQYANLINKWQYNENPY